MIGSDKQIQWAEAIREKMIDRLKKEMSSNTLPPEIPDRNKIFQIICRQHGQAIFLLEKTGESAWFIENKDAVHSVQDIYIALEIEQHDIVEEWRLKQLLEV